VYFPSYASPVSGEKWTLGRCLDHVVLQKQYFHRNAGKFVGIGITPWKRRYISQFLRSPDGQLRFSSRDDTRIDEIPMYWSYRDSPSVDSTMPLIHEKNNTLSKVRVEDGFVRSIGLGSDFVAPSSLVFDDKGLYFDASAESALENMLNEYELSDQELNRGRAIRLAICEANISKYNVGKKQLEDTGSLCADQKTVILVVGQVDGDQSLLRGTVKVQTNDQLLRSVRENNPDSYIIYKPHPDVVSGNRKGAISATTEQDCVDETEYTRDFLDCLPMCSEVHTMTSLSGFEALLRGKKVFTYGMPFYAGWGLTTDAMNNARRKVSRNIDELVFLCMHKYPHYVDLKSGEFVSIETIIGSLNDVRSKSSVIHKFQGLSKIVNIVNALVYKA
jgi:capsular polysaccharide export protein